LYNQLMEKINYRWRCKPNI